MNENEIKKLMKQSYLNSSSGFNEKLLNAIEIDKALRAKLTLQKRIIFSICSLLAIITFTVTNIDINIYNFNFQIPFYLFYITSAFAFAYVAYNLIETKQLLKINYMDIK